MIHIHRRAASASYEPGELSETRGAPVPPAFARPLNLQECTLVLLNQPLYREGRTANELADRLAVHGGADHLRQKDAASVYAAMSGMQARTRRWIEPAGPYKGRNEAYRITDAGRAHVRTLFGRMKGEG